MSQTAVYQHHLLGEHHGLFSNSWGVPRLQLLSQKTVSGNLHSDSNFPLNNCNLSTLTEARILVREDLRRAVRHYNSHQARYLHANKGHLLQSSDYGFFAPISAEYDVEVAKAEPLTPSCSVLKPSRRDALQEPRNVLKKHLLKRFPGLENEPHTEEVLNYAMNSFLQEFETSDSSSICNEILARNCDGTLFRELDQLLRDKHVETSIEAFHDLVASNITETGSGSQETLCKPVFFNQYAAVWQINSREFREYTLEEFLEDFSANSRRYSHISGLGEMILDFYCELGLAMSFTKVHRYYEREARRGRPSGHKITTDMELESELDDVVEMLEMAERKEMEEEQRMRSSREFDEMEEMDKENSHESRFGRNSRACFSKKLVSFLEPSKTVYFGRFEPPYYVRCEVNGVEFVESN